MTTHGLGGGHLGWQSITANLKNKTFGSAPNRLSAPTARSLNPTDR